MRVCKWLTTHYIDNMCVVIPKFFSEVFTRVYCLYLLILFALEEGVSLFSMF